MHFVISFSNRPEKRSSGVVFFSERNYKLLRLDAVNIMIKLSIIIPTRNRARMVQTLLNSVRDLAGLDKFQPQIIVGDNNSQD